MTLIPENTEILVCNPDTLERAAQLLRGGDLVAVPTETVYGLAGVATNPKALGKIYAAKGRPITNPLIIHVPLDVRSVKDLDQFKIINAYLLRPETSETLDRLMTLFWPGPLTLIAPRGALIPGEATAGGSTVAIRQSSHPDFQYLLKRVGAPLAAPSANRSNRISPTCASHVYQELKGRIPLILDGGSCQVGVESTVIQALPDGSLQILRPGGITEEHLHKEGFSLATLRKPPAVDPHLPPTEPLRSPGQLPIHYAPETPLYMMAPDPEILKKIAESLNHRPPKTTRIVLISLRGDTLSRWENQLQDLAGSGLVILAPTRRDDSYTIARELFSLLRQADQLAPQLILIDHPPEQGDLWPAIFDRLKRASKKMTNPSLSRT
jgi:L-threonylcarbamoyladenylate synthase